MILYSLVSDDPKDSNEEPNDGDSLMILQTKVVGIMMRCLYLRLYVFKVRCDRKKCSVDNIHLLVSRNGTFQDFQNLSHCFASMINMK